MSGGGITLLTADLVRAFRRKTELKLRKFDDKARAQALSFSESYLELASQAVDASRKELMDALSAVEGPVRDQRLADGLR